MKALREKLWVAALLVATFALLKFDDYKRTLRRHDDHAFEEKCKSLGGVDLLLLSQEHRICVRPLSTLLLEAR